MNEFLRNEGDIEVKVAKIPTNMDVIGLRQQMAHDKDKLVEEKEKSEGGERI